MLRQLSKIRHYRFQSYRRSTFHAYAPRSIPLEKLFFSTNRPIENLEQKFDLLNNDLYNSQLMSWNVFIF